MSRPRALGALALALYLCVAMAMHVQADFGPAQGSSGGSGSGDIEGVIAGAGLTGGGTSGTPTLNVAVGTGLTAAADEITLDAQLVDLAGLAVTDGGVPIGDGSNFVLETGATLRTSIGVGTGDSPTFTGVTVAEQAAPGAPAAGLVAIYAKTDGLLYGKDDAGTETQISNGAGGSGDVVGPASATDNAVVRFDSTTGKLIQNSTLLVSDDSTPNITSGSGAVDTYSTLRVQAGAVSIAESATITWRTLFGAARTWWQESASKQATVTSGVAATVASGIPCDNAGFGAVGGTLHATVMVTDGTNIQALHQTVSFAVVNKGDVYTTDINVVDETSAALSSGTLTATWAVVTGTNSFALTCTPTTSLTATDISIRARLSYNTDGID